MISNQVFKGFTCHQFSFPKTEETYGFENMMLIGDDHDTIV